MKKELVMTVLAEDRPGLVARLADCVRTHGGNWIESRMSQLGGRFAGIVRVEVPEESEDQLAAALRALVGLNLTVETADAPYPVEKDAKQARLEILAQDRPGIIAEIFGALSAHRANVTDLTTERFAAPMSAELLFKATARLRLPPALDAGTLHASLESIAHDLTAELHLAQEW
ncbi:MAG: ACT domain-containing protein [Opitutales bacterium]|nr:ACT domain-containing protein [Opitutales bacterium]